jgi:hypothetical protein
VRMGGGMFVCEDVLMCVSVRVHGCTDGCVIVDGCLCGCVDVCVCIHEHPDS